MATMTAAFSRLANSRKLLLPAIHKIWPVIMNRLKEQKRLLLDYFCFFDEGGPPEEKSYRSAFLLPSLLEFISLLSLLCGDFMSLKLKVSQFQYAV